MKPTIIYVDAFKVTIEKDGVLIEPTRTSTSDCSAYARWEFIVGLLTDKDAILSRVSK